MKKLSIIFLTSLLSLTVGCNDTQPNINPDSRLDGASDGGGGEIPTSTEQQVRDAFAEAYKVVTTGDQFFVVAHLGDSELERSLTEEQKKTVTQAIVNLQSPNMSITLHYPVMPEDDSLEWLDQWLMDVEALRAKYSSTNLADYMRMDQIVFVTDNFCVSPNNDHADASVDKFDVGAKVCFSIKNLMQLPPQDLQKNIAGLIAHELTHIFGYNEDTAIVVQEKSVDMYNSYVRKSTAESIPNHILSVFFDTQMKIKEATWSLQGNTISSIFPEEKNINLVSQARFLLGRASGELASLQDLLDPSFKLFPLFKGTETEKQSLLIIEEMKAVEIFLKDSIRMSDSQLFSPEYIQDLEEQQNQLEEIKIKLVELIKPFNGII